jgi:adenylate cyclase
MLWLQSNAKFDEIAKFNPNTMKFNKISKRKLGSSAPAKFDGFYSDSGTGWLALYKHDERLIFASSGKIFVLDNNTIVNVYGSPNQRKLEVVHDGNVIYSSTYLLDDTATFHDDPTAFIEDEDLDFGLFVSNVSKNPERKAIMLSL